MAGLEFMGEVPFRDIYITGLVRDINGRKMSKSLGNGIDPLDIVARYGADAHKFTLAYLSVQGSDVPIAPDSFQLGSKFANKIWNASRFVLMNLNDEDEQEVSFSPFNPAAPAAGLKRADRWILHRYNETVRRVSDLLENYELGEAAHLIYEYLWNDFCDWYVELSKHYLYSKSDSLEAGKEKQLTRSLLVYLLDGVMRLLHPFMPFISEEIWQQLPDRREKALVVGAWPEAAAEMNFSQESDEMELFQELVRAIRNLRSQVQLPPGRKTRVIVRASGRVAACFREESHHINRLASADPLIIDPDTAKPKQALTAIIGEGIEVYLPLEGIIDLEAETARLEKELEQLNKEIERTDKKLKNPDFIKKAPPPVVQKEKDRRGEQETRLSKLKQRLQELI